MANLKAETGDARRNEPVPIATVRRQIVVFLRAWGMTAAHAASTADTLAWANLHGIDSHGISMITEYEARRRKGGVRTDAVPRVVRDTPVAALIDGDGGFGHVPAAMAVDLAIAKARVSGIGTACVRNSAHCGAIGYFTSRAAAAGLVAMGASSASMVRVAPTGGAEARLGTDPWSFAAPSRDGRPFLLDMATTTAAFGKIRNRMNEQMPLPPGWGLDAKGRPTTSAREAADGGFLTPLGGTREGASHKGYGLSVMVNILAACLSGASLVTDPMHARRPDQGQDIGHFFLALDPGMFRDAEAFQDDVGTLCNALRATRPLDPDQPVLVAGDPERSTAEVRRRAGVPIPPGLVARLREIAARSQVAWLLGDRGPQDG